MKTILIGWSPSEKCFVLCGMARGLHLCIADVDNESSLARFAGHLAARASILDGLLKNELLMCGR